MVYGTAPLELSEPVGVVLHEVYVEFVHELILVDKVRENLTYDTCEERPAVPEKELLGHVRVTFYKRFYYLFVGHCVFLGNTVRESETVKLLKTFSYSMNAVPFPPSSYRKYMIIILFWQL